MRRAAILLSVFAAMAGVVVVGLLLVTPLPRDRLLDVYVLFLGALAMLGLVHATRTAGETGTQSLYERALRRHTRAPERPAELSRLEREVTLAAATSFDLHRRVRPLFREIAAHRLASRRGLQLDEGTTETRALLGEELWELVQPVREPPDDRLAPGLPLARQRDAVERLERI